MANKTSTAANIGFEQKLWQMADALRSNMDAAEYKHIVLGLIFLKYISDAFQARYNELLKEKDEGADPESRDEYTRANVFWVSKSRKSLYRLMAVLVLPPCCVIRGRHLIFTAPRVKESSEAILDHT